MQQRSRRIVTIAGIVVLTIAGILGLVSYRATQIANANYESQCARWWALAAGGYEDFANQILSLEINASSQAAVCHNAKIQLQNLNSITLAGEVPPRYKRFHTLFMDAVDASERYYQAVLEIYSKGAESDGTLISSLFTLGKDVEDKYSAAHNSMPEIGSGIEPGTYVKINTHLSKILQSSQKKVATPKPGIRSHAPQRRIYAHRAARNVGMLPQSQWRRLDESDLYGLSPWGLSIARNEIYARHGRPFARAEFRNYFLRQPWYEENPNYSDSWLSPVERYNARFILEYQRRYGLTY